ncbi:UDP-glucose/GDP-mannose dehydrogenase family protein [Paenibacillus mesophilus]|uniref:UDP-glucose dehydrogenase family protein n=1 Tax=Paenibacillus mesophilus TaxID=2582849 RepID=UPI00110F6620|nr:UDP-glucose/GDP-mannose dehydrogenase family protein [Paenibacillus mesophilus]TMV46880.1 UDP-glucose/GDP-mannose dehydrogenase family protein [Paenibacillus mesophilus]
MKITVIGSGYVGLVTGACLASLGHQVICADTDAGKIGLLASGKVPLFEEGLEPLVKEALTDGRIRFTTELAWSIEESDILFITVGTPSLPDGEADLTQLWSVVNLIAKSGGGRKLLVIKSTVPVGTCDSVEDLLRHGIARSRIIDVAHNPEFLRQGNAVRDFLLPDRIVVGCKTEEARTIMSDLYAGIASPVHHCDRRSAELIKYGSNAFLAMKISFINMMANLSDELGVDVDEVSAGIGADRRIGPHFLQSGIGYGGSCFPKDMKAIQALGKSVGCELPLIEAAERINGKQPQFIVGKLKHSLQTMRGSRIALLGLTFKPMTDDIREAPSLTVCRMCLAEGAIVHAYDPMIRQYPMQEVVLHGDAYSAIDGCDAIVLLTEWDEFRLLDWGRVRKAVRNGLIVDGRNMLSHSGMRSVCEQYGMTYLSVGRPAIDRYGLTSPGVIPQYLRNTRVK